MDLALESCVDARLKTRENRKKQTHQTHGTLLAVACSIPNALDCIKVNGKRSISQQFSYALLSPAFLRDRY